MANGKSSTGFWLLISTLLIGGGVGIYFLLRTPKEDGEKSEEELKREEEEKKRLEDEKNKVDEKPKNDTSSSSTNNYVAPKSFTFPFTTEAEGNTFRAWVIAKDPTYAKSIDLSATGKLNSYVEKAWVKYGTEYTKSGTNTNTKTPTLASKDDIAQIISFADKGEKTNESYLKSTNQNFVKEWAKNIRASKTAFIWSNQVYRTKTGSRVLDFNPTSVILYSNKSGNNLVSTPSKSASRSAVLKNESLGKGGAVTFADGYLYVYLPSKSKWIASIWLSRYKLNFSGFSGGEE